jgi:hypothetical protein
MRERERESRLTSTGQDQLKVGLQLQYGPALPVEASGYRSRGLGSIPGTTRFSEK